MWCGGRAGAGKGSGASRVLRVEGMASQGRRGAAKQTVQALETCKGAERWGGLDGRGGAGLSIVV